MTRARFAGRSWPIEARPTGTGLVVVIVAYPLISNLDEFASLSQIDGLSLHWARDSNTIASADLLIRPGSKQVADGLAWLRKQRLDRAIAAHVSADKPTLAICGGLQMLTRLQSRLAARPDARHLFTWAIRGSTSYARTVRKRDAHA